MIQQQMSNLIEAIKTLLSRFSDKSLADNGACERTGILVQYNTTNRSKIAFQFHTHDRISFRIVFDLNELSEDYINGMMIGIMKKLSDKRKERSKSVIEIATLPQVAAVAGSKY